MLLCSKDQPDSTTHTLKNPAWKQLKRILSGLKLPRSIAIIISRAATSIDLFFITLTIKTKGFSHNEALLKLFQ